MDKRKLTPYLTDQELCNLHRWMRAHDHDPFLERKIFFVRFVLGTGLRIGECSRLLRSDCRPDGVISVTNTKTHEPRLVMVSPELCAYYVAHLEEIPSGPFFVRHIPRGGCSNMSVRGLREWWYAVLQASGTRTVHPHAGRHTYATWELASERLNIKDIQSQLGHRVSRTTFDYYLHSGVETRYRKDKTPLHWSEA